MWRPYDDETASAIESMFGKGGTATAKIRKRVADEEEETEATIEDVVTVQNRTTVDDDIDDGEPAAFAITSVDFQRHLVSHGNVPSLCGGLRTLVKQLLQFFRHFRQRLAADIRASVLLTDNDILLAPFGF